MNRIFIILISLAFANVINTSLANENNDAERQKAKEECQEKIGVDLEQERQKMLNLTPNPGKAYLDHVEKAMARTEKIVGGLIEECLKELGYDTEDEQAKETASSPDETNGDPKEKTDRTLEKEIRFIKGVGSKFMREFNSYNDIESITLQTMIDTQINAWDATGKVPRAVKHISGEATNLAKYSKMTTLQKAAHTGSVVSNALASEMLGGRLKKVPGIGQAAGFVADTAVKGVQAIGVGSAMLGSAIVESAWETYEMDKIFYPDYATNP